MRLLRSGAILAVLLLAGCGGDGPDRSQRVEAPRLVVPAFGKGPRYHPPPGTGPVSGLRCGKASPERYGAHLEVFANRRDVVIPAGIGIAPPRTRDGAYVTGGRCSYPLRTVEPTGLIEVDGSNRPTLGHFFDLWGQPLSSSRLLSFQAPPGRSVSAFVNGRRWHGGPRSIPLARHAAIVLEVGGYFPPTRHYVFPEAL